MDYSTFIRETLVAASAIATRNFGKMTASSTKADDNNQVLTETDIEVGKLIIQKITENFPEHNIIDEEAGVIDKKSALTWVVDPIDGTSNFALGLPTYGIMIGLLDGNTPIVGGIVLPAFDQLYFGQKGLGAFCNGERIHVSEEQRLLSTLVAYGIDGHQEDPEKTIEESVLLAKIILNIRNLRTTNSAYDMVQIPAGRYGAFLNKTTKIWDNVVFQALVEEAGGIVTDFDGKPMDYTNPLSKAQENFTVCAGAPTLHRQLQKIIHAQ
jgi:myo-inositol-1(or 4)-monophosphatase